ncbi:MAG: TRAP transporter substrate-binding protein [Phycisphaerae bacterium]|nr:TRAP transporter substrate-binding protein [Phycisphaerae bacterium]
MTKTSFLRGISIGVLIVLAVFGCREQAPSGGAGGAASQPALEGAIVLTYANFPPAKTFPCVQMERWKTEIEKRTQGKVTVKTSPGGTLLGAKNMFDGIISGVADIGNFAMSYQPGRFPVSEAVDQPLSFASAKAASLALYDLIEKYQPKEFEKVKLVTLFACPPASIMTTKPVRSLADLKGMSLRVSGTATDVIKSLGATPVGMPQSDTPDALQKGVIQGVVSSLEVLQDMGYASYCPYATPANLHVVTFAVVMNLEKWESLPADVKKAIDELRRDQAVWTGEYVDQHVAEALAWAKEKHNHQVNKLPDSDLAQMAEVFKPLVDAYVDRLVKAGLPGKEIMADLLRLKAEHEKAP